MGKSSQYGVILDAGSSGTRIYVYKWKHPVVASGKASKTELKHLPQLKLKENKKIHPGVSNFAENVSSVGPDHLQDLVDAAIEKIPSDKLSNTPIFLMATAGVRFLPASQQRALLQGICTYLQTSTQFLLPDCSSHIQVISGETEGLYGWLAANYLLGTFDQPEDNDHGDNHHTYGFLDMGGASAQIAFAPNSTEAEKHFDDLKLIRLRHLDGSTSEYKVFTATWLGFGANKARSRFVESLLDEYGQDAYELPDPCLPEGLRTTIDGELLDGHGETALVGTGDFEECLRKTYPLLGKDAPCDDQPCLLDGQHVPGIDFDINHFVGVSEYWHTTHGVFGSKKQAYDVVTYQSAVIDFCSRTWSDIAIEFASHKKTEKDLEEAQEVCFKASWIINMLYDGIGFPRVGLEEMSGSHNVTKEISDKAKEKGFGDPFEPIDTVQGVELSWTLGKMVLYAAGQIMPSDTDLPVGFGSNNDEVNDFEMAGSLPLTWNTITGQDDGDDDDDWDDLLEKPSQSTSGLILLIFIFIIIAFLLRKPERRRRLVKFIKHPHRPGILKGGVGFSLPKTLFGRSGPAYERVLEDGDASDFELRASNLDDTNASDSPESFNAGKVSGKNAPKLNLNRSEDVGLPSALDRTGMVVRTCSWERLGPSIQMLNAGRRSRAGSPTRQRLS